MKVELTWKGGEMLPNGAESCSAARQGWVEGKAVVTDGNILEM